MALLMGILFIAMFVVRGDLRVPVAVVALFMFLGNLGRTCSIFRHGIA
jgi:hypothetical protein